MTLSQWDLERTFIAVIRHRSFAAAAPDVGLTTRHGVRYRMMVLQKRMGRTLFETLDGSGPARLTDAGKEYHDRIQKRTVLR